MKKRNCSIIVPNYNHAQYLEHRLQSIFNQKYQNFEVILLDDCSTDESREILFRYSDHPKVSHIIFNKENSGNTFSQWNKGISFASGEFIWIAESDDFCEPDFLEKSIEVHLANPEISLSFCQSHMVNSFGKIIGNWISQTTEFKRPFTDDFVMDGNKFIEEYLINKNVIPNVSGVLFKRKGFAKITPLSFKPFLKYNADWFYYIQLICNSKVAFLSESLNHFRYHNRSVIGKSARESGLLQIFKMELEGRKLIMNTLRQCPLPNMINIERQNKKAEKSFRYKTAQDMIDRQQFKKAIQVSLTRPFLALRIFFYLLKKI